MVISRGAYLAVLAAVAAERGFELALSRAHARQALSCGALEHGRGLYRAMAAFHALFLLSAAGEAFVFSAGAGGGVAVAALGATAAAQLLRYWAVITLGRRWNTRIIVAPQLAPVTSGPYRFVRHPNYLAVVIEMVSVPMIYGCWRTAILFSCANAVLLAMRISREEKALGENYAAAFHKVPRFIPSLDASMLRRLPAAIPRSGRDREKVAE
jgi:methyltransferase